MSLKMQKTKHSVTQGRKKSKNIKPKIKKKKTLSKNMVMKYLLDAEGGGWTPYEGEIVRYTSSGKEVIPAKEQKGIIIGGQPYKVSLKDRFTILEVHLKENLKPVLNGTTVKIWLGTPKKESYAKHRWSSGLDYAESVNDDATVIEFTYNKSLDKIREMKTKDGRNLMEEISKAQNKAIAQTFGDRVKTLKGYQYFEPQIEWESDWEGDNMIEWGLMKNSWHPDNM